jgi:hypothetical protein
LQEQERARFEAGAALIERRHFSLLLGRTRSGHPRLSV